MKRCGFFYLAVVFLCFASLNAPAQRKEISKEEYYKVIQSAERNTKNYPYRINGESKTFRENEKRPFELVKRLYEFQPNNGSRFVSEAKNAARNNVKTIEIIELGRFQYTRINNGPWQSRRIHGFDNLPVGSIWRFEDEKFYLTENVKFKNRKANLYEYAAGTKVFRFQIEGAPPLKSIKIRHAEKRWISADGLMLKVEIISDALPIMNLENSLTCNISSYEYDSKIKIKAPIPEPKSDFTVY